MSSVLCDYHITATLRRTEHNGSLALGLSPLAAKAIFTIRRGKSRPRASKHRHPLASTYRKATSPKRTRKRKRTTAPRRTYAQEGRTKHASRPTRLARIVRATTQARSRGAGITTCLHSAIPARRTTSQANVHAREERHPVQERGSDLLCDNSLLSHARIEHNASFVARTRTCRAGMNARYAQVTHARTRAGVGPLDGRRWR